MIFPPYWTLKRYRETSGQLGHVEDYEDFLAQLDGVWQYLFELLVPGGRLICVVGDVCLSRRKNNGEHTCVPLHSSIQEHCRKIGFSNLAPIIWRRIANATYEVPGNSRFLGKPYEPNGVVKDDIEHILMLRKAGGYREPSRSARLLSIISMRLVRMFSFVGDAVLDPFMGTATTDLAAAQSGRNSIGFESDAHYFGFARDRPWSETADMFTGAVVKTH